MNVTFPARRVIRAKVPFQTGTSPTSKRPSPHHTMSSSQNLYPSLSFDNDDTNTQLLNTADNNQHQQQQQRAQNEPLLRQRGSGGSNKRRRKGLLSSLPIPPPPYTTKKPISISNSDLSTAQSFLKHSSWEPADASDVLRDAFLGSSSYGSFSNDHGNQKQSTHVDVKKSMIGDNTTLHYDATLKRHYTMHQLRPSDSLRRLSLIYSIPEDELKMFNGKFATSDVQMWGSAEIRVPVTEQEEKDMEDGNGSGVRTKQERYNQLVEEESDAIQCRNQFIMATAYFMTMRPHAKKHEATYYILLHEGHCLKAIREYDTDLQWERRHQRDMDVLLKQRTTRCPRTTGGGNGILRKLKQLVA